MQEQQHYQEIIGFISYPPTKALLMVKLELDTDISENSETNLSLKHINYQCFKRRWCNSNSSA
jgi:hypothetical protein